MGFFENWISDKVSAAFGRSTGMLQPVPAGGPPLQARENAAERRRALVRREIAQGCSGADGRS